MLPYQHDIIAVKLAVLLQNNRCVCVSKSMLKGIFFHHDIALWDTLLLLNDRSISEPFGSGTVL